MLELSTVHSLPEVHLVKSWKSSSWICSTKVNKVALCTTAEAQTTLVTFFFGKQTGHSVKIQQLLKYVSRCQFFCTSFTYILGLALINNTRDLFFFFFLTVTARSPAMFGGRIETVDVCKYSGDTEGVCCVWDIVSVEWV